MVPFSCGGDWMFSWIVSGGAEGWGLLGIDEGVRLVFVVGWPGGAGEAAGAGVGGWVRLGARRL